MKKLPLILITLIAVSCSIKDKPLGEKLFFTNPKGTDILVCHKTSDCNDLKDPVHPVDSSYMVWTYSNGDYNTVLYCSKCLSDKQIIELREHWKHQYKVAKSKEGPEETAPAADAAAPASE